MKLFMRIVTMLVALSAGIVSYARTDGHKGYSGELAPHWATVGVGGYPRMEFSNFIPTVDRWDYFYISDTPIQDIYKPYYGNFYSTGSISGEFGWNIGRWFSTDIELSLCPVWTKEYDGNSGEKIAGIFACAIQLMPEARLMYINRKNFRFYSSLGVGIALYPGTYLEKKVEPAIQFNPIGLEFGGRFFGTAKLGIGTDFLGAKLGLGYRF